MKCTNIQRQFRLKGLLLLLSLALLVSGCFHRSYKPYAEKYNPPPPDYPGREQDRFFGVERYPDPPEAMRQDDYFGETEDKQAAPLEPAVPRTFEFTETASYRLGPGDVLEIIYQLKAERRTEEYRIAIQDELEINFYYTPRMNRKVTVRSDGKVSLPLIGDVEVFGKTTRQVEGDLHEKYKAVLKDPDIDVFVTSSNWAIEELKRAITTAPRGQSRMEPVRPDGYISLPLIGDTLVGGKTVPQASDAIRQQYRNIGVEDIDVTVVLLEVKAPLAFVIGEVQKPGPVIIAEREDIWQTIAMVGGFTQTADMRRVLLVKNRDEGETRHVFDFQERFKEGDTSGNMVIKRGDMIYVPMAKDQYVYILGAVEKPGRVTLDSESVMTASQALAMAGRIKASANRDQVFILRRTKTNEPILIAMDMKALFNDTSYDDPGDYPPRDPRLQPGDIVYVPEKFIGNVNLFIEAYFKEGLWTLVPFNMTYDIN